MSTLPSIDKRAFGGVLQVAVLGDLGAQVERAPEAVREAVARLPEAAGAQARLAPRRQHAAARQPRLRGYLQRQLPLLRLQQRPDYLTWIITTV